MRRKDYHSILGVQKGASQEEIKAAYRRAVLKHHPDRGSRSTTQFHEVQEAYEALTGQRKHHQDADIYSPLLWHLKIKEYPLDPSAIRMKADQRVATPEDEINVTFILTGIGKIFYIKGLNSHFEIVQGPNVQSGLFKEGGEIKVKWFYSYTLRPKKKGYLTVGPCLAVANGRKFRSSPLYIKVADNAPPDNHKKLSARYYAYIVLLFVIFGIGAVVADQLIPQTEPELPLSKAQPMKELFHDPSGGSTSNRLQTGDTPFDAYLEHKAVQDGSGNMVRFINGPYYDAVVCLTDAQTGKVVRNGYIKAGEMFEMKDIEKGQYFLRLVKGKGWNPEKEMMGENIKGGFQYEALYKEFSDPSYRFEMDQTDENGNLQPAVYQLKLYSTSDGNMSGDNVAPDKIFGNP